jgi:hypothetical protein
VVEQRRAVQPDRFDTTWKVFAGWVLVREVAESHL